MSGRSAPSPQAIVRRSSSTSPGVPLSSIGFRRQDLHPFSRMLEPGARAWARTRAPAARCRWPDRSSRSAPRPCRPWRHRSRAIRAEARAGSVADRRAIRSSRRRPVLPSASVNSPAFRRSTGISRLSSIGPVSSPASICMMVTPVVLSPARIARWIGAAPRHRGSSEAWTLMQPSRGASSTACGRISP